SLELPGELFIPGLRDSDVGLSPSVADRVAEHDDGSLSDIDEHFGFLPEDIEGAGRGCSLGEAGDPDSAKAQVVTPEEPLPLSVPAGLDIAGDLVSADDFDVGLCGVFPLRDDPLEEEPVAVFSLDEAAGEVLDEAGPGGGEIPVAVDGGDPHAPLRDESV